MKRVLGAMIVAVFALGCASCGSAGRKGYYPVDGKVLYQGSPAAGVQVIFHPKEGSGPQGIIASGVTNQDGSFSLTSNNTDEGAPPGSYYVFLMWPLNLAPGGDRQLLKKGSNSVDFFKGRYTDHKDPKFFADVKAGPNHLAPFEVTD